MHLFTIDASSEEGHDHSLRCYAPTSERALDLWVDHYELHAYDDFTFIDQLSVRRFNLEQECLSPGIIGWGDGLLAHGSVSGTWTWDHSSPHPERHIINPPLVDMVADAIARRVVLAR